MPPSDPPGSLPPPRPLDPWEEQRRRAREHRASVRRRRIRRIAIPVCVTVTAAAIVGGAVWIFGREGPSQDDAVTVRTTGPATTTTSVSAVTTPSTVVPSTTSPSPSRQPVEVGEVWLLDRGDGEYDWGLTVRAPEGGDTRSDVAVRVRLVDAGGDVLEVIERVLHGVNDRVPTAVAGRFAQADGTPSRLDFDVTIGVSADDPGLGEVLATRAVERIDDRLEGRIRLSAPDEVTDVAMVLVWRDEEDGVDDIVDVVVYEIERLRPEVDARFDIDLTDLRTPDGLPDDVFWAPTS